MMRYLLDTSALMALLENEAGADQVQDLLLQQECLLSALSLVEVTYITQQEKGEDEAHMRYALLTQTGAHIVWHLDEATVLTAARLKAKNKISFADAMIAACAIQQNAVLVHKDPEFECLAAELSLQPLLYKTK